MSDLLNELRQRLENPSGPVECCGARFEPEGITSGGNTVAWERVRTVEHPNSLAGFNSVSIIYEGASGPERIVLKPRGGGDFNGALRCVIHRATGAAVSPSLLKLLAQSPSERRMDYTGLWLIVTGLALALAVSIVIVTYAFSYTPKAFPTLVFVGAVVLAIAAGAFNALRQVPAIARLGAACLVPVFAAGALMYFFGATPGASMLMAGDAYAYLGDDASARARYEAALEQAPDSVDVKYALGIYWIGRGEKYKGVKFLEEAYEGDPYYWSVATLRLIPETYGELDEPRVAVLWARRIKYNYRGKYEVVKAMEEVEKKVSGGRQIMAPDTPAL